MRATASRHTSVLGVVATSGSSGAIHLEAEHGAQLGTAAMQQDALVAVGDTEQRTDVGRPRGLRCRAARRLAAAARAGWEAAPGPVRRAARRRCARRPGPTTAPAGLAHAPLASKRSTTSSSGRPARRSRSAVECARLSRIRNSQVLNDDRPSNRSTPRTTAIQVSWHTSSATARLPTVAVANRSSRGWYRRTSSTKAASSPARTRSTSPTSSSTPAEARASSGARRADHRARPDPPQRFASRTRFIGVSAARRNCVKPASSNTWRSRASPACAPRPRPTSCESELGVQIVDDAV